VPTDFSDYSQEALQYGISFCQEYDANLVLLHVIEDPFYLSTGANFGFDMDSFFRKMEEKSEQQMIDLVPPDQLPPEHVERVIVRGTPFLEIIRSAKEQKADMLVIATHGRTGLAHVLMGSVTEKVVRKVPCPVLVVRKAQHEFVMP
jgi:nucleotide-binding universal stress UspA family protein